MTWLLVAQLVFGPKLTPAEAARILANCTACLSNVANLPIERAPGPQVITVHSLPGALGWQPFPPEREPRRLDGTLLSQPVTIYGNPYHLHHGHVLPTPDNKTK